MQLASFTGFINTICILVCIYYGFKILFRIFAPVILRNIVKKAENNFRQQQNQYNQQNKESDIYMDTNKATSSKPRETKKVGEYVDYEEIE